MSSEFPFKVETTKAATADRESQRWPVRLRPGNTWEPGRTWVFTDGGGAGRYAAALARPNIEERRVTGCREGSANSVVAELDGIIIGLEHSLPGKNCHCLGLSLDGLLHKPMAQCLPYSSP